ncbi:MAG: glycogen/starch synthase [Patescibacteria group bacterium]
MSQPVKVLFVASELNPIAKVGGLADVIGALPKALKKIGVDVRIAIPKYGIVDEKKYPLTKIADAVSVPFNHAVEKVGIYETPLPGSEVPVYLIDSLKYLGENGIYFEKDASSSGSSREAQRFIFFARAVFSLFGPLQWYPDIIHSHDWHVGYVPLLLKILAKTDPKLQAVKAMLSIHNLEYQGQYNAREIMDLIGLNETDSPTLAVRRGDDLVGLQQAILTSDYINTVSPQYAKEILTPEYGAQLENDLTKEKDRLVGILNGIDVDRFNPATDKDIVATYSAEDPTKKLACKADLQKTCGLAVDPRIPVLGIVTRFAEQKGVDLLCAIGDKLAQQNIQLVLLGTGLTSLEESVKTMVAAYPDKMFAKVAFDAKLAQQIYAGSDIFLMPSKFEPCGLGQMIAMRYGTIPVVRATGGLIDTVKDYNPDMKSGDGFVFSHFDAQEFFDAIMRALALYQDQETWYKIVRRIMQYDFSWTSSAKKYLGIYKKLIS